MKLIIKTAIIVFFGFLPAVSFANADDWWYGGDARVMSIGEVSASIPDYSNVYDLYDAGFPTALLWRDEKSVEGLSSVYNASDDRTDILWGAGNILAARAGKNGILALDLFYSKQDGRKDAAGGTVTGVNLYSLSGSVSYIHKFPKDVGISLTCFSRDERGIMEVSQGVSSINSSDKSGKSTGIGVSVDKYIGDLQLPFVNDLMPKLDLALTAGYKVNDDYRDDYLFPSDYGRERQNDKLINIGLGISFTSPKQKSNLVFSVQKSFVVDYSYHYDSATSTSTGVVIDETRFDLNAKLNYYITDFLLASAKLRWKDPSYAFTAGVAIINDLIRMPMEYVRDDIDGRAESLGVGLEYEIAKLISIRIGARAHGNYNLKLNYTAGIGLETKNFLCDIGMAYETDKGAWTNTRLLADVKAVW